MRFKNVQCVYCDKEFDEKADVVVCPQCGSPHHRECWKENGSCKNEELHKDGYVWEFPEHLKPPAFTFKKPRPAANETNFKFRNGEVAVTCPHCGALNYGFDAVCMQCKQPLDDNRITQDNRDCQLSGEQLFEYYRTFGGVKPETEIGGIAAKDYVSYIGANAGKYIRKFAIMERFGKKFTVSLCAFLLGPIWFLYRKLYKEGILFLLAGLILTVTGTYCTLTEPVKVYINDSAEIIAEAIKDSAEANEFSGEAIAATNAEIDALWEACAKSELSKTDKIKYTCSTVISYINLSLSMVMGLCADVLYRKKTARDINSLKKAYKDDEVLYRKKLGSKGGTSTAGAVAGIISAIAVMSINFLPTFLAIADKIKDISLN